MTRIGLAGLGRMGGRYLKYIDPYLAIDSRVLQRGPDDIVLISDPATLFSSMLSDIDLAIIATPAATHADLVCAALEAGKPTLCEKPLCTTREELARIRAVWERTGTQLLVDHTHLWHPDLLRMREQVETMSRPRFYDAAFGNQDEKWDRLEWLPHPLSIFLACGYRPGIDSEHIGTVFIGRSRLVLMRELSGNKISTFSGDAPCDPPPLARVVDDFVNQRTDWRWNEFGFRVTDLVLQGMNNG